MPLNKQTKPKYSEGVFIYILWYAKLNVSVFFFGFFFVKPYHNASIEDYFQNIWK